MTSSTIVSLGSVEKAVKQSSVVHVVVSAIALVALLLPGSALADVVYTYTGNSFDYVGTDPDVTHVSGSFTLPLALPADTTSILTPDTVGGTITDYQFTDGRSIWDKSNYIEYTNPLPQWSSIISVTTNAGGGIDSWYINIYSPSGLINSNNAPYDGTLIREDGAQQWDNYNAFNDNAPGGWVVSPEPATLSLLALGGLAVLRRRLRK